jgi:hypothetical protein
MRRRELLQLVGGTALAWPLAVRAQQQAVPVVGYLGSASPGPYAPYVAAFHQGLAETGYADGRNVTMEYRWADARYEQLPALAADLVARHVDVIVTSGGPPRRSRQKAQPRRSRSSSRAATRSSAALSPASPGRMATSPGSASSAPTSSPSASNCWPNWFLRPRYLP